MMDLVYDLFINHYWFGFIVSFVSIWYIIELVISGFYDLKINRKWYLFLLISLFSWFALLMIVVSFVGFLVLFVLYYIIDYFI